MLFLPKFSIITHQGYKLKKNGYRRPAEAYFARNLTQNIESYRTKIPESIRGEKGVEKNLSRIKYGIAYDSVKVKEGNEEPLIKSGVVIIS